jgi:hypothetical protein
VPGSNHNARGVHLSRWLTVSCKDEFLLCSWHYSSSIYLESGLSLWVECPIFNVANVEWVPIVAT